MRGQGGDGAGRKWWHAACFHRASPLHGPVRVDGLVLLWVWLKVGELGMNRDAKERGAV